MRPTRHASVDSLFNVLDALVDDRTGIIRGVSEIPNQSGAPDFFHYAAEACNSMAFAEQRNFSESGGVSTDRRIAMAKAVGEAVERYCSALYVREELPLTSSEKAPFRTVDPSEFALFTAEQYSQPDFRCVPFTRDSTLRWTEAMDLATQCNYYVPACMVYAPYFFDKALGERPVTIPISTGLACHSSWTKAAITAICEVIERDAFTITWQSMLAAPPILLESLSESNRDLIERFVRTGASIRMLNLTLDHGTPCILSVLSYDRTNAPALVFAASASTNPEDAVRKSLEELAHTHRAAVQLKSRCKPFLPKHDYSNVINQETHIHLYTEHVHRSMADFLYSSQQWTEFEELPNISDDSLEIELCNLVKVIASRNYQILIKELTTADVKDLGLSVIRAVMPGFHPLFMGHGNRALGGVRLWTVPQSLGYKGITDRDNPAPHPYP